MKEVGIGLFHAPHACMAAHFERCQLCRADMLAVVFPHMTLITGNTHIWVSFSWTGKMALSCHFSKQQVEPSCDQT